MATLAACLLIPRARGGGGDPQALPGARGLSGASLPRRRVPVCCATSSSEHLGIPGSERSRASRWSGGCTRAPHSARPDPSLWRLLPAPQVQPARAGGVGRGLPDSSPPTDISPRGTTSSAPSPGDELPGAHAEAQPEARRRLPRLEREAATGAKRRDTPSTCLVLESRLFEGWEVPRLRLGSLEEMSSAQRPPGIHGADVVPDHLGRVQKRAPGLANGDRRVVPGWRRVRALCHFGQMNFSTRSGLRGPLRAYLLPQRTHLFRRRRRN
jgi:hypothetical protein